MYHLPGNLISGTVGLVYINLQPEYELTRSIRFGQVGAPSSSANPKETSFCRGSEFLFVATCVSDFSFYQTYKRFPQIGVP